MADKPEWWDQVGGWRSQVKKSIEVRLGEEKISKKYETSEAEIDKIEFADDSRHPNLGIKIIIGEKRFNYLFNINLIIIDQNTNSKNGNLQIAEYNLKNKPDKQDHEMQKEKSILSAFRNSSHYPTCQVELGDTDDHREKKRKYKIVKYNKEYEEFIIKIVAAIRYFLNPPKEFAYSALDDLYHHHKCIVLYGPPGTGKTFIARRLTARIMGLKVNENNKDKDITFDEDKKGDKSIYFQEVSEVDLSTTLDKSRFRKEKGIDTGQWALVQFHPSYNHEDFVRGISVETHGGKPLYQVKDRILARMAKAAMLEMIANVPDNKYDQEKLHDKPLKELFHLYHQIPNKEEIAKESNKFVLIIDEINRASLASILGELIYGLEYRGEAIRLPHALKDGTYDFLIPENLYIIGTMNTADRTIGSIDYAVRRRFAFFQCPALENVIDAQSKGRELFKLINKIFTHKRNGGYGFVSPLVDPEDIRVGHSYFICKNDEELWFNMKYKVLPLLVEYYRDGLLLRSHKVENYLESFKKAFREASDFSDASERIKSLINKMEGGLRDGEN